MTFIIVWAVNEYNISFDTDGGSLVDSIIQDYGTSVNAPQPPAKEGYSFVKWQLNGEDYMFTKMPAYDITLKAVWVIEQFIISFDTDGSSSVESIVQDYGTVVTAPQSPIKEGHFFIKWQLNGEDYEFTTMPAKDITLKAVWKIEQFTISFDTDDGSSVESITQDYGTEVTAPQPPTKEGYSFIKWQLNGKDYEFTTMPAENITLKAVWEIAQFTISFDTDGGSTIDSITQDYGTSVNAPESPIKEGYSFVKWQLNGKDYEFTTMPAKDITLKAVWVIEQFTISFDTDGGSSVESITQDYNTSVIAPVSPEKEGHSFVKWQLNGNDYEFTTMLADNITLKAVWDAERYAIIFLNEGEVFHSEVCEYGSEIPVPADEPTKVSSAAQYEYKFLCWKGYTEGMKVSGEHTFKSEYETSLKIADTSGEKISWNIKDIDNVNASSEVIDQIKKAGADGKDTTIEMSNGSITLDGASASSLTAGAKEISLQTVAKENIPEKIRTQIGDRPVYSINIGDVHEFGGKLTISVKYDLREGEKAEDVCIWYLKADGSYERISCTYADGYATFVTTHLSEYAVMVEESQPAPTPEPEQQTASNDNGGMNIGLIIGGIVGAIAVIGIIAFVVLRGRH